MGYNQQKMHSREEACAAGKAVVKNSHDTQQSGVKQSLKQNVTNNKVPEGKTQGQGPGGARFGQRSTGSKTY